MQTQLENFADQKINEDSAVMKCKSMHLATGLSQLYQSRIHQNKVTLDIKTPTDEGDSKHVEEIAIEVLYAELGYVRVKTEDCDSGKTPLYKLEVAEPEVFTLLGHEDLDKYKKLILNKLYAEIGLKEDDPVTIQNLPCCVKLRFEDRKFCFLQTTIPVHVEPKLELELPATEVNKIAEEIQNGKDDEIEYISNSAPVVNTELTNGDRKTEKDFIDQNMDLNGDCDINPDQKLMTEGVSTIAPGIPSQRRSFIRRAGRFVLRYFFCGVIINKNSNTKIV